MLRLSMRLTMWVICVLGRLQHWVFVYANAPLVSRYIKGW
ncbi:hypothetical protein LCGC14_2860420 [marine sediment metagenome]|uniref:Uncharacterized protein n=1 Tax=marine sediment metagenome TaxID=412755 RepID=A0A0F9AWW9_9ZZZZ